MSRSSIIIIIIIVIVFIIIIIIIIIIILLSLSLSFSRSLRDTHAHTRKHAHTHAPDIHCPPTRHLPTTIGFGTAGHRGGGEEGRRRPAAKPVGGSAGTAPSWDPAACVYTCEGREGGAMERGKGGGRVGGRPSYSARSAGPCRLGTVGRGYEMPSIGCGGVRLDRGWGGT